MIRLISSYVITLLLLVLVNGCKKDNYEKPSSLLSGKVVYDKEAVGLRSNGVQLELWQHGFELFTKIPVYVAQDGTFSASLFNGSYKLVRLPGNGPWVNNIDSIDVTVNGNTVIEVPVQPYFVIKNATISKSGTTVTGTFSIVKVANGGTLESVALFVGKTNIVDAVNNLGSAAVNGSDITDINAPVTVTLTIPGSLSGQSFFFARVSVKTAGVAEHIYSQPIKIE
ncbi:DUF3823 domain-containing protein [Chitinophaga pinensis]|uniref:DUF3823 domain-containing protein n=1 Tax=Chitinophaga pinensis (strain ATCC 43595 / DSM 2588 / LMG 13176 / NBRC 15968 / NCIMB 11800 / UQM 2034) TaxID=485918 RepID=A0A979GXF1_CHIPD|nr:DUF3823 domain-containing protein [Chitinophaga pinensis]ACU62406.1 hypothetical protein Cpin_4973 [Chitinophaga pinensis DSM 2588]